MTPTVISPCSTSQPPTSTTMTVPMWPTYWMPGMARAKTRMTLMFASRYSPAT